jgi:G6PDH family F420-dependent oxidoreductase
MLTAVRMPRTVPARADTGGFARRPRGNGNGVTRIGYVLSCEEFGPQDLVAQARAAEDAGFEALWISDHFHPWTDAQGQSPFVWSVIGALSQATRLPVTVAVTCPTVRIHPAIIAQAAATSAVLCEGRFVLGVGSGEALNEHILGDVWPTTDVRLEMLEEAVHVIRTLWSGEFVTHRGRHYTVDHARIYTRPPQPPPIYVSGFGPKSIALAARIGDGYITTKPHPDAVRAFRDGGGGDKPVQGAFKGCYAEHEDEAVRVAHERWPNSALPGELAQVLPSPRHFEQAAQLLSPDEIRNLFVCGSDPEAHLAQIDTYVKAGFDEVYVTNIGPYHEGFFRMYAEHVLPARRGGGAAA